MEIDVKFFASLRERMGRTSDKVTLDGDVATVSDVWNQLSSEPIPNNILVAVNKEYTDLSQELKSGDEVAFFPPVTGG
ncbi:MAG TPA: molybdopterin converting factor subunit 1 [Chromatiales bacterium]|nr:molybdopterin converting factor subunit 1 [Chromatiales bacterium]